MKKQIIKILKSELKMTQSPEYKKSLESVLTYAKTVKPTFEGNMNIYNRAKVICNDTCPREELYLAKLAYLDSYKD